MPSPNFNSPAQLTTTSPPKTPRLTSLLHRLQHARDTDGQPIPLLDELLFFLDDPPPGTADRWQKGADLCAAHGIPTSRVAVWRLYRVRILPWRREQLSAPPSTPPDPAEITRLHDQARHLAAQRLLENLHDPHLSPSHLVGLVQCDNHRQQIQLARDQFNDRVTVRRNLEQREHFQRIDNETSKELLLSAQMEFFRKLLATLLPVSPDSTS
jgi:hypothetical protein